MRAVIIGNGDINDYAYIKTKLRPDDYIICADGGLRHIDNLKINADIAIGDFDSACETDGIETCVYPVHKDFTDGEIAVNYALEKGYSEVLLIAMTGSRIDHTLTNIFQLIKNENITLIDDKNEIRALKGTVTINNQKGKTLSIIPIFSNLEGVKATGVFYPINGDTLYFGEGRGNSNIITNDLCTISIDNGIGLIIINDGE